MHEIFVKQVYTEYYNSFFLSFIWTLFFYFDFKLHFNYYESIDFDSIMFIFPIIFPSVLISFFNGTNRVEKIINFLITSIFGIMVSFMIPTVIFLFK